MKTKAQTHRMAQLETLRSRAAMKITKRIIGYAPVDSGTLMIADPCYLVPGEGHHPVTHENRMKDGEILLAHVAGTGLIFSGFGGDGCYPVTAQYDENGRCVCVTIDFYPHETK